MTPEQREFLTKKISFAIGLCMSIKPEVQALAVLNALEEYAVVEPHAWVKQAYQLRDKPKTYCRFCQGADGRHYTDCTTGGKL